MFYTYLTQSEGKYGFGVSSELLCKSLPSNLCYFEVFTDKKEAKRRREYLKKLSYARLSSLIKSKNVKGFTCHKEGEKTIICLKNGVYNLTEAIMVRGKSIEVRGEKNTVIQGCAKIDGWIDEGNGVFSAETEYDADALYINGEKYQMARFPKYNPKIKIYGGFSKDVLSKAKADTWKNPKGAYIHAMHLHNWGGYSYEVTGKDENGNLTYIGGWQNNRQMGMHSDFKYIENVREEMTEPGEWYFDKENKRAYVILKPGHSLNHAEICVNSSFFVFKRCKNVSVENIKIKRAKRTFMQTNEPLLRSDWTIYRGGAIYFTNSSDCSISKCSLFDIGTNGIFIDGKNRNIKISKCHFKDLGASGVCFVGNPSSVRSPLFEATKSQSFLEIDKKIGPKSNEYPKNCTVEDCLIEHVGALEKQATGVEISMSYGIRVINTSIYDASRAGINISEGTFGGHIIDGCDVFDTVKETGDHGSFNSWGRDRYWHLSDLAPNEIYKYAYLDCIGKTVIRNSRFRCDRGWDIDLDDGSSNYEIYNNLCLNGGIKLREGFGRYVHNNIMINNSIHMHVWYENSGDVVENNIIFTEYQPILMENGYGKSIDFNILHSKNTKGIKKAPELEKITGMDKGSIKTRCIFRNARRGDYTPISPKICGFEKFPCEFGVRYEPLKKLARTPVIPKINQSKKKNKSNVITLFDMKLKNIETDGEMSAFATAGHNGVLVCDVDQFARASAKGILPCDVIVNIDDKEINSLADLEGITKDKFLSSKITVWRAPKRIILD
ncbi:MAG: PDZ domain-containing protein [Ruminococcaceae bacterium]|nr:PDZ domain-containing protein [Oscillospiraceae bacterium]